MTILHPLYSEPIAMLNDAGGTRTGTLRVINHTQAYRPRRRRPVKNKVTTAHLRQLCSLDLSGEILMPAVLKALHGVVESGSNAFFWVDANYEIANICAERMLTPQLMRLYFTDFYDHPEYGFKQRFSQLVAAPSAILRVNLDKKLRQSDYYQVVLRHLDVGHVLYAAIRQHGKAIGQLSLYRSASERPFTKQDESRLATVTHYIAHALARGSKASGSQFRDSDQLGVVAVNADGEPRYMCPEGRRLMILATHPTLSKRAIVAEGERSFTPVLGRVCRSLENGGGSTKKEPLLQIDNVWGRFVFHAHRMEPLDENDQHLIAVLVERQELHQLQLLAQMGALPLSPMQREVALRLVNGNAHAQIAKSLGVSLNTVNYHVRQVFLKLDVHSRDELVAKLQV